MPKLESNKQCTEANWQKRANIATCWGAIITLVAVLVAGGALWYSHNDTLSTIRLTQIQYEPYLVMKSKTVSHYWISGERNEDSDNILLDLLNIGAGAATKVKVEYDFSALETLINVLKTTYGNSKYDFFKGISTDDLDDTITLNENLYRNSIDDSSGYFSDTSVFQREYLLPGIDNSESVSLPWFYTLIINHIFENDTSVRTLTNILKETPIIAYVTYGDILHEQEDYYKKKMNLYVEYTLLSTDSTSGNVEYHIVLKDITDIGS